jgi:hypothetical protein
LRMGCNSHGGDAGEYEMRETVIHGVLVESACE